MKNIFLLPTYKPSRLFYDISIDKLILATTEGVSKWFENKHVYITNDEEIKEGDWACHNNITIDKYQIVKCNISNKEYIQEHWNKIILTTDQELIADGVKAIDDCFLEWYVKNPSCKSVEVN